MFNEISPTPNIFRMAGLTKLNVAEVTGKVKGEIMT